MPSDHYLHPASILFSFGAAVREFALPGLFLLIGAGSAGWGWQVFLLPLFIPYVLVSIGRYLSFRYRYEPNEMVIRTGFLFRNERHVPYARIQNIDAVQNVVHRLLGVVEVRVQTGGGAEPEAKLSVLPVAVYEEMRRRIFDEKSGAVVPAEPAEPAVAVAEPAAAAAEPVELAAAAAEPAAAAAEPEAVAAAPVPAAAVEPVAAAGRILLRLPPRELLLHGLIYSRGGVALAAVFGLVWELDLLDGLWDAEKPVRGKLRDFAGWAFSWGEISAGRIALAIAALAGLLVLIRLLSMLWALVQMHGFRLERAGSDLRAELGLLTRVATTIPLRRIQTLTVQEGPLHRLFGRVSVRADTAGGSGGESGLTQRAWLAPMLRRGALPELLREVLPESDLSAPDWKSPAQGALRRKLKQSVILAVVLSVPLLLLSRVWGLAALALFLAWVYVHARQYIAHLGWAVADKAVLFRSGWLWRRTSVARFAKIQAVAFHESPFDRRAAMARMAIDTAGAGDASHRLNIPYLPRATASELCGFLAREAGQTAFRW